jgi:hypothetical protein
MRIAQFMTKRSARYLSLAGLALGTVTAGVLSSGITGCSETASAGKPASAQQEQALTDSVCIQDNWAAHGNTQRLTCTANDVRVAEATNICVHDENGDCLDESTCIEGTDVTFTADFLIDLSAQTRYDIGVYFATDGGGSDGALTGQCVLDTLDATNAPDTFINRDSGGDLCGDIDAAHDPQIAHLTITTACVSNGDEENPILLLPNCTSWRQPGSNELCDEASDAFPGAPSKCNCDSTFAIAIRVEEATASVTKTATAACVTFAVNVANNTQSRDLTLATLDDDLYGDITDATNANLCGTTCGQAGGAGSLPVTLVPNASYSCQFSAKVASSDSAQTDTVTATFQNETLTPSGSATIIVDLD